MSLLFLNNALLSLSHVRQIQAQVIVQALRSDTTIAAHFIAACESLGVLNIAHEFFITHFARPHVFICNSLIKAFAHAKIPNAPCSIYRHMRRNTISPNNYTYPFLFKSLADFSELKKGQWTHCHVVKLGHLSDIYVINSLLNMYASKGGDIFLSRKLFDEIRDKDVVTWTVLVTGYRKCGRYEDALISFEQMMYAGLMPNRVTMVNVLAACSRCKAIDMGVWIHEYMRSNDWEMDLILGTALIDMYGACGKIDDGLNIFYNMKQKNLFTWNTVIKGLGSASRGEEAVWCFNRMQKEGIEADEVTLTEVLSACSKSGLLDIGRLIFISLLHGRYAFPPSFKHYACFIGLLAQTGCLEEGLKVVMEMPYCPTTSVWMSLFHGCRNYGDWRLFEFVAEKLVELETEKPRALRHVSCDPEVEMFDEPYN